MLRPRVFTQWDCGALFAILWVGPGTFVMMTVVSRCRCWHNYFSPAESCAWIARAASSLRRPLALANDGNKLAQSVFVGRADRISILSLGQEPPARPLAWTHTHTQPTLSSQSTQMRLCNTFVCFSAKGWRTRNICSKILFAPASKSPRCAKKTVL
jgi:hypothetical protein